MEFRITERKIALSLHHVHCLFCNAAACGYQVWFTSIIIRLFPHIYCCSKRWSGVRQDVYCHGGWANARYPGKRCLSVGGWIVLCEFIAMSELKLCKKAHNLDIDRPMVNLWGWQDENEKFTSLLFSVFLFLALMLHVNPIHYLLYCDFNSGLFVIFLWICTVFLCFRSLFVTIKISGHRSVKNEDVIHVFGLGSEFWKLTMQCQTNEIAQTEKHSFWVQAWIWHFKGVAWNFVSQRQ